MTFILLFTLIEFVKKIAILLTIQFKRKAYN